MKNLLRNSLILILMAAQLILTSCSRQMVYSHYENVGKEGWERWDSVSYVVPIREDGTYAEDVGIRSTRLYPFMNIAVIVGVGVFSFHEGGASQGYSLFQPDG